MLFHFGLIQQALSIFVFALAASVRAQDEAGVSVAKRVGYLKGDPVPVSCLNRTIETGEHITDDHGNLQYIPFMTCDETKAPLQFAYGQAITQTCTIASLSDELYHLIEYFVHSDVPLSCRVPSYPLRAEDVFSSTNSDGSEDSSRWTPFTIALQGILQHSHLHLHTNINALFHTEDDVAITRKKSKDSRSHLIASTAYSLPDPSSEVPAEGMKIVRNEPLTLTFNVGWIDGVVLPGMVGRPVLKVTDHSIGFSFLTITALGAAFGLGALGMLVYERRKSGRSMNGLLGGNVGNGVAVRSGYGGYGGYSNGIGKRD